MNMIVQNYMEALGKQVFSRDFIINGLFPCQSAFTKMIDLARIDWKFNDKFEYRMLFSNTNSGGTINTQVFNENFKLQHPGSLEYGIFRATYGTIMDGFTIDMVKQLETRESRASFNREYAMRLHSMRINVASIFKNIMIHGRYGVMHRVMPPLATDDGRVFKYLLQVCVPVQGGYSPWRDVPIWTPTLGADNAYELSNPVRAGTTGIPAGSYYDIGAAASAAGNITGPETGSLPRGSMVRFQAPRNVYASNFKTGRRLVRASVELTRDALGQQTNIYAEPSTGRFAPWGRAFLGDMWVVKDNQPQMTTLVYIGPDTNQGGNWAGGTSYKWYIGDYLQMAENRRVAQGEWNRWSLVRGDGTGNHPTAPSQEFVVPTENMVENWRWAPTSTGDIDARFTEGTGAMEGISDIIPWYGKYGYADGNPVTNRLGLDRPFRAQPHRKWYSTEQAGMYFEQQHDQTIMNVIMQGVEVMSSVVDWEDLVIFIHPTTLTAIGMYEQMIGANAGGLQVFQEVQNDTKLIYQRGVTGISFRVGEFIIPNIVKDWNFPTDVILIGPKKDLQYNCWDNAAFELNQYIQDTFSGKKPPPPKDVAVPKEILARMDISSRITYGAPVSADLKMEGLGHVGNEFVHPSNSMPVAYHEMGALFTENPFAYGVVKLRNQLVNAEDSLLKSWVNHQGAA